MKSENPFVILIKDLCFRGKQSRTDMEERYNYIRKRIFRTLDK